jgi:phosphoribosylglycinamide formyltransferase 2
VGASAVLLASENSSKPTYSGISGSSFSKTDFRIFGRLFQDPTAEWEVLVNDSLETPIEEIVDKKTATLVKVNP